MRGRTVHQRRSELGFPHTLIMLELQILQLNVRKQLDAQHSLLNDKQLQNHSAMLITEPHAWPTDEGELVVAPLQHNNWLKFIPSRRSEDRWQIRSMLWVRKDIEVEQVMVDSSDITAVTLALPNRRVFLASIYVPCQDPEALESTVQLISRAIKDTQLKWSPIDIILSGDFNRHDALWGGDHINPNRQGEAAPILDMMNELRLSSLLPRGTITWQKGDQASTIDLVLASTELSDSYRHCKIYDTEHGSDHSAIDTLFDVNTQDREQTPRLLFKNAPWSEISARVAQTLRSSPRPYGTQAQADRLLGIVESTVKGLTPRAKPSPYAKRWWTEDLTKLRNDYTKLRNQAKTRRQQGGYCQQTQKKAKEAAKVYHSTLRKQRKAHWEDFLSEDANIWTAARYMKPDKQMSFSRIPPLRKADGSTTEGKTEQAKELLQTFFPPLPAEIDEETLGPQRQTLPFEQLTQAEVERKLYDANP